MVFQTAEYSKQMFFALQDLENWGKSKVEPVKYETFLESGCSV